VTVINFIGTFFFLEFELREAHPKPRNPVRMNHIEDCPFDTPVQTRAWGAPCSESMKKEQPKARLRAREEASKTAKSLPSEVGDQRAEISQSGNENRGS
jgi:hypothetical protein